MSLMVSWGVLMYYLHNKGKSFFFSEIVEFPLLFFFLRVLPFGGEETRCISFVFLMKETGIIIS